jgi:hypothetical protein
MGVTKAIINAFAYKITRNWDTMYWGFDIHGTILKPNYTYGKTPDEFYPMAKETLQLISKLPDVVTFLYTCSHPNEVVEYIKLFEDNNIHFKFINENPDVPTDINGYGCYDKKPYMNVLFEDKAGFDPMVEWQEVYDLLIAHYGENN